jgi:hypothetical protein
MGDVLESNESGAWFFLMKGKIMRKMEVKNGSVGCVSDKIQTLQQLQILNLLLQARHEAEQK